MNLRPGRNGCRGICHPSGIRCGCVGWISGYHNSTPMGSAPTSSSFGGSMDNTTPSGWVYGICKPSEIWCDCFVLIAGVYHNATPMGSAPTSGCIGGSMDNTTPSGWVYGISLTSMIRCDCFGLIAGGYNNTTPMGSGRRHLRRYWWFNG